MNGTNLGLLAGCILLVGWMPAKAEMIGEVEFPAGIKSFADCVKDFEPDFQGGPVPEGEYTTDPLETLGAPNFETNTYSGTVSLGHGGRVAVEFVDNFLTSSGDDRPDLYIFEVGPDVEDTFVEISPDGETWTSVGKVDGSLASVDLDAFGIDVRERFRFVRLRDDPDEGGNSGFSVGADIDAIGAISATDRPEVIDADVIRASIDGDESVQARTRGAGTPDAPELIIALPSGRADPGQAAAGVLITWDSYPGMWYQVQSCSDLVGDQWDNVGGVMIGDGVVMEVMIPVNESQQQIYRVVIP